MAADPPVRPGLDDELCLAMYRASRAMTATYRPLLAPLGLTYPQYLVMALLWEDGTVSVTQIGRRLSLESSTLSPLLKRLEVLGLVSRTRRTDDERSVSVAATDAGVELREAARDIPRQICQATGLDLGELAALTTQLRSLAGHLENRELFGGPSSTDRSPTT
jgi:DNA-binding MarR family transcriptional regulator